MNFLTRPLCVAIVCLAAFATFCGPAAAQAPAPPQPVTRDVQAFQEGNGAFDRGAFPDAIKSYEGLIKAFPTFAQLPEARFRLGYAYYNVGEYDKALEQLQAVVSTKGAPEEVVELALVLTPQVSTAKAAKLPPDDPARNGALAQAVKGFDAYLAKYPASEEAETAHYGKALALYQLSKYEEAASTLRASIQRFAQSETIQESQYLLALTIGTIANVAMEKAPDAGAQASYDQAEALLRDIITKRLNLALVNDAQFQVGELLFRRGGFIDKEKQKEKATAIYDRALEAYRAVLPKELVVRIQQQRIATVEQRRIEAGKQKDAALFKRLGRVKEKENEKLAQIQGRPDQTLVAKVKCGEIFFQLGKIDEARVLLSFTEPLTEDPEQRKEVLYFLTLTYAVQNIANKALEDYDAFKKAYKEDPLGQNLPLIIGSMFLSPNPKLNDPDKAIQYFREGIELYPNGKFTSELLMQQALAMIQQKKYDEAEALLKDFIARNPSKELAAAAGFGLATIYKDTGKMAEAVKMFREVRDKYAGTPSAEQAAYWSAQLLVDSDPKAAIAELQEFRTKFEKSELVPQAMFALGLAQVAAKQQDAAIATFKELPVKFPKSAPAPFAFFERAKIHQSNQKFDETIAVMREFIDAYPASESLFQAYDFIAQLHANQQHGPEAVATYEEFVSKHPKDPNSAEALVKLSSLWKAYAEGQGAYISLDVPKRAEWQKGIDGCIAAAERVLKEYPESPAGAAALQNLLAAQKLHQRAKPKEVDVTNYFLELAKQNDGRPGLKSKIMFTLASYTYGKDKPKAIEQMSSSYHSELKYSAEDLDLYGLALLDAKKYDEAIAVYEKLAKDYPVPANVEPNKAPRPIQEAQAISLFGVGKALQEQDKKKEGAAKFAQLEQLYPWSKKKLEVNYGLAVQLHEEKSDEDAVKRLLEVIKAREATAELRARSMLLLGKIYEDMGRHEPAIDHFMKISVLYGGVPEIAAEGLWRGAQLLEKQANGQLPMPTPIPKPAPGAKTESSPTKAPAKDSAAKSAAAKSANAPVGATAKK